MPEYIEREAVVKMLENSQIISDEKNCGFLMDDISVYEIPAADVAPVVHGRWEGYECGFAHCSVCGCFLEVDFTDHNYCANCGAKMDLEAENVPGSV